MLLSDEALAAVSQASPCRGTQIELLNSFLSSDPQQCPPALLVYGANSTGKSAVLTTFLSKSPLNFSVVRCDQCATTRIMLQRALREIRRDSGLEHIEFTRTTTEGSEVAIENLASFFLMLQSFERAAGYTEQPHVLVLDRIDKLPDNPSDLYSCFARMPEMTAVRNLVVVFTISTLEPRALITTPIPHIQFPRYTRQEAIKVLQSQFAPTATLSGAHQPGQPPGPEIWNQYVSLVVEALSSSTGTDIRVLKDVLKRVWPQFIKPLDTDPSLTFANLYKLNRHLFTTEAAVTYKLVDGDKVEDQKQTPESQLQHLQQLGGSNAANLPKQSKYILCAAYLASYNPPRYDIRFFSRAKEARAKRRDTQRRKKLKINPRSLAAPEFELERMLAILHSIVSGESLADELVSNIDIGSQIATLTSLKLIVRKANDDPLHSRTKWRVNVSWSFISQVSAEIGLHLEDYLME